VRVGVAYDLREDYLAEGYGEEETAEFDRPSTIEAIATTLESLGHAVERIGHARSLMAKLAAGQRWDLVFNIAEGLRGLGREALVPALLDAFDIPYTFSDPMVLALTLHKGMTKHVVRDLGIPTPAFVVVERESDLAAVGLPFPLFAKPVAEGTGKGITSASKLETEQDLHRLVPELLARFRQPVLVEAFLPGREFTVGILGTGPEAEAIGVMEVCLKPEAEREVYSYVNKERCEEMVEYRLANDVEAQRAIAVALAAWQGLGCRDGGRVDLRSDAHGSPHFLEVNPLAGLHPEHSDLPILCTLQGISYRELMARIVASTLQRIHSSAVRAAVSQS
jgi:D-alanine-D-alanine ligase